MNYKKFIKNGQWSYSQLSKLAKINGGPSDLISNSETKGMLSALVISVSGFLIGGLIGMVTKK